MLAANLVLVSASKRTAPWCLKAPLSMEHRNYSFSFLLTGHSFCRSSVTVALMKKYGSSLCPCPPHLVPLADNLPRPRPGPPTSSGSSSKAPVTPTALPLISSKWSTVSGSDCANSAQSTQGCRGRIMIIQVFMWYKVYAGAASTEVNCDFFHQAIEEEWKLWAWLVCSSRLSFSVALSNQ